MKAFFDTNILIYGLVPGAYDSKNNNKHHSAARLVDECVEHDELVISTQVMNEFFVNATKKGKSPLTYAAAARVLERMSLLEVVSTDKELVLQATLRVIKDKTSYWDALIVEAAIRGAAAVLYSEDLQHGMRFDSVQVRNPFMG